MYHENHIKYYNSIIINITKIISEILEYRCQERNKDVVEEAVLFIEQNACNGNINIRELSERAGVSYEHFIRLFKKQTGKSPAKYINDFRLMLAEKFLRFTDEKIGKVALMSGFSDVSHLNEAFRKKYGVSPSVFRKSNSDI